MRAKLSIREGVCDARSESHNHFSNSFLLFTPKKTEHDVKKVKIVKVFKKIRTIAIFMRKDVPNPGKLVW